MADREVFTRLLDYLLAEGELSSTNELLPLSDLDQADFEQFVLVWSELETSRRIALLSIMGKLTDKHIELIFDRIYQMAFQDPEAEVRRIAIENLWESEDPKLISHYLKFLEQDASDAVRISAVQALGRYVLLGQYSKITAEKLMRIEDALLESVAEDTLEVQRACIEALGYSSRPGVDAIIQTAYLSEDEGLRQSSIRAMGRSANDQWAEAILKELISHSPKIRSEAAKATGELEIRSAVGGLIELLDDVNDEVRGNAIWSLGQIGGTLAREALEALQATEIESAFETQVEEALEHIAFLEGTPDFLLFDYDDEQDELG